MESIIPINGRVAIVDDKIEQALPLMRVFAKNNIPYVFTKAITTTISQRLLKMILGFFFGFKPLR